MPTAVHSVMLCVYIREATANNMEVLCLVYTQRFHLIERLMVWCTLNIIKRRRARPCYVIYLTVCQLCGGGAILSPLRWYNAVRFDFIEIQQVVSFELLFFYILTFFVLFSFFAVWPLFFEISSFSSFFTLDRLHSIEESTINWRWCTRLLGLNITRILELGPSLIQCLIMSTNPFVRRVRSFQSFLDL